MQFSTRQLLIAITIAALVCGGVTALGVDAAVLTLIVWSISAGIASLLTTPIVFVTRRRVRWQWWETSVLVAPFAVWTILSAFNFVPKSIANFGELFKVAIAIPVIAVLRAIGTKWFSNTFCAACFIAIPCVLATAFYFLTPWLPE